MVSDFTEKSKEMMGGVGGAVTGATTSVFKKMKTYLVDEGDQT
jgi:hypothetical protein